jgi:ubiquinone/menaquinone biosynthesis C-methylase UbiE
MMHVRRADSPRDHQEQVNSYFGDVASYWADVYERDDDVNSVIFQERLRAVLALVDRIALPRDRRVAEIGCGAGYTTIALAKLGYEVAAIDSVIAMVDATRDRARRADLQSMVKTGVGDLHALPFQGETFGLALAIGVLPWLQSIDKAMKEMCRVLQPGGYAIMTVDNRWGLRQFVEPFTNPLLRSTKELTKGFLRPFRRRRMGALNYTTSIAKCDSCLCGAGFDKLYGATLGFGPFSVFNYVPLPSSVGLKVHHTLQGLADRNYPVLRSCGYQYLVLAQKRRAAYRSGVTTRANI